MQNVKEDYNQIEMFISEIFYTIQGEGFRTGKPSIFIRLSGCNLQCIWCDTKFTWLFSKHSVEKLLKVKKTANLRFSDIKLYDKKKENTKLNILKIIEAVSNFPSKHLVLTGGEPLLQKEKIVKLLNKLKGFSVEIETNGTISPSGLPNHIDFNVSPKLSNSFNSTKESFQIEILKEFANLDATFKYVISNENDIQEVFDHINLLNLSKSQIILMPEATDKKTLEIRQKWLIEICKKENLNYGNRLQIQVFGSKRGV